MEAQSDQNPQIAAQVAKTLAEEREFMTPEEPDSWYDSQESQKSFQQNDQKDLQVSNATKTSNILGSISFQKSELSHSSIKEQLSQKNEHSSPKKLQNYKINGEGQRDYKVYYHKIDDKISFLLFRMLKCKLVDLAKIAELAGKGAVELFCKTNQLIVKTLDKETADEAINKLSDFIDDLNVLKLDIKPELANKLQKFQKIKHDLFIRKIMLFNCDSNKENRGLYIGGLLKLSELKKAQLQIRNYKIFSIRMRLYRNRRSYKLVLDHIFESESVKIQMFKLSGVNMIQVDKYQRNSDIQVVMNIQSKIEIPASEYEDFINKLIKNFMVLCFILKTQPFFEKLAVPQHPEIKFIYVKQRNNRHKNMSYLFIITQVETFFKFSKAIEGEIEKVGKFIMGIRFFNNFFPNFNRFFFEPELYYVNKFPKKGTYSMIVVGKQREGKRYDWRLTFAKFLAVKQGIENLQNEDLSIFEQESSAHEEYL